MEKKGFKKAIFAIFMTIFVTASVSAVACTLDASLLSQDPYPADPDEYVKVVFQINGTENPECGNEIFFDIVEKFPFSLDSNSSKLIMSSGNFINGYPNYLLAAYKLRVDKNALDGPNKLTATYGKTSMQATYTEDFDVEIEDSRTDFDVLIKDYIAATNTLTFAIINVGKKDVEALTLEIPKQGNIEPLGTNKVVIGSLNANDDTTVSIKAIPKVGEILINLEYNDQIGVRRPVEKVVTLTSGYLANGGSSKSGSGAYFYLFWLVVILLIAYNIYAYFGRKARAKKEKLLFKNLR